MIGKLNIWLTCLLAMIVAVLIAGCGPKVKVGYQDASFTPAAISARGLAIGGIAWRVDDQDSSGTIQAAMDSILWLRLTKDLKDVHVKPVLYLRSALGEVSYRQLMNSYDRPGNLTSQNGAMLKGVMGEASPYIIFGRIDRNRITTERADISTSTSEQFVNITTRRLEGEFRVYDSESGQLVWHGRLTAWKSSGKDDSEKNQTGFLEEILSSALFGGEPESEFPDPPSVAAVAWKLYGGLTKVFSRR